MGRLGGTPLRHTREQTVCTCPNKKGWVGGYRDAKPHPLPSDLVHCCTTIIIQITTDQSTNRHPTNHHPTSYHLPPTTYHLPPTTYQLPTSNYHLSPATCHLPPTTYHLPLTTYHRPPTTYDLPPITYHLQPTTYHLPLTTYHLPLTTYHLPLTTTTSTIMYRVHDDLPCTTGFGCRAVLLAARPKQTTRSQFDQARRPAAMPSESPLSQTPRVTHGACAYLTAECSCAVCTAH